MCAGMCTTRNGQTCVTKHDLWTNETSIFRSSAMWRSIAEWKAPDVSKQRAAVILKIKCTWRFRTMTIRSFECYKPFTQRHGVTSHKTGILSVSGNFSLHTKNLTKPRRIRSAEYVSRIGDRKDAYWVLMGSSDRKRPLGRRRRRWEDNTNVNLQQVEWGGMDWIGVAGKWESWRAKRGNEPSGSIKFGAFLV